MSQRDYDDEDNNYGSGGKQQDDKPLSFRSPNSRTTDRYATAADRYSSIATGSDDSADRKVGGGDRYSDRGGDRGGDRYGDRGSRGGDRYSGRGGDRGEEADRGGDGGFDKRRGGKTGDGFFSNSSGGGRGYDRGDRSDRGGSGSGGGGNLRDKEDTGDKDGGYQRRERRGHSNHATAPACNSPAAPLTLLFKQPTFSLCPVLPLCVSDDDRGGDRRRGGGSGGSSREDRERERQERRDRIPAGLPDLDALQLNDPNRPKLKLAPRGTTQSTTATAGAAGGSKPNPFGEARPREENLASKEPALPDARSSE